MAYHPHHSDDDPPSLPDAGPSFADILSEYEQGKHQPREEGADRGGRNKSATYRIR